MATQSDFSPVEWTILTELPVRVVAAAVTADPASALGSILEQVTGLSQLANGAAKRRDSELVTAIFADYKSRGEGEERTLQLSDQWVDDLLPETILRARQAGQILAKHHFDAEAEAFSSWLYETAEAVCIAAKTGGVLGIGGKRISDSEAAFLRDLKAAFAPEPKDQS